MKDTEGSSLVHGQNMTYICQSFILCHCKHKQRCAKTLALILLSVHPQCWKSITFSFNCSKSIPFCPTTAMANKDCDQEFCEELKKFFDSRGGSVKVRELKEWLAENCKGRKNEVRNSTHHVAWHIYNTHSHLHVTHSLVVLLLIHLSSAIQTVTLAVMICFPGWNQRALSVHGAKSRPRYHI